MDSPPAPLAAWQELWQAAQTIHPPGSRKCAWNRARYILRGFWRWRLTKIWLQRLMQADTLPLYRANKRLAFKLQRNYLRKDWSCAQRRQALFAHYEILPLLFRPAHAEQIFRHGLTLLTMPLESPPAAREGDLPVRVIEVRLIVHEAFEKEGELTLNIFDRQARLSLANLTFSLGREGGKRVIWIGGLQAQRDLRTREFIKRVTADLHGLRPKALALWCLQTMADAWGMHQIHAVGDANHVCGSFKEFHAQYDVFWSECSGTQQADGTWVLPIIPIQRDRGEVRPARRKAHALRYAMLKVLKPELLNTVASLAPMDLGKPIQASWVETEVAVNS